MDLLQTTTQEMVKAVEAQREAKLIGERRQTERLMEACLDSLAGGRSIDDWLEVNTTPERPVETGAVVQTGYLFEPPPVATTPQAPVAVSHGLFD